MKKIQSILGDHQDAVIACQVDRELGISAHLAGENPRGSQPLRSGHQGPLAAGKPSLDATPAIPPGNYASGPR